MIVQLPFVSIITATFNSSNEIEATYLSLTSQTHRNWEWLITDDCSTDCTVEILRKIVSLDSRVSFTVNSTNSGAAVSRNQSINRAKGDFIAFIDSDDIWLPEKLHRQLNFMGAHIDFSFTAYNLIDSKGLSLNKVVDLNNSDSFSYSDMLMKKATMGCSTVMLRCSAFDNICMPLLRTGQDYATWLRLLKSGKRAFLLNEPLTSYRILPNSISRNKVKKAIRQWQIYRRFEKLSLIFSLKCFIFYAWRAVFRK